MSRLPAWIDALFVIIYINHIIKQTTKMVNETKTFAEYKTPKCRAIQLKSSDSLLAGSPADTTINDWEKDPDAIDL